MSKVKLILRGAALAIPAATAVIVGAKELAKFFQESGIYAQPIILSGKAFMLSEGGVTAVHEALEANDRDALLSAAKVVLTPADDFDVTDLVTSFAPLLAPVPTDGFFKDMVSGALVVMGESRSGKTRYIRKLAPDLVIRISEPVEADDASERSVSLADYRHAIGLAIATAMSGRRVAVDSLRGLTYRLRGNTLEGGVSAGLFELLTTLNNVVASVGASVIFSVNPMTGDDAKLQALIKRVEASVAGVVLMAGGEINTFAYRTTDGRRVSDATANRLESSEGQAFENTGLSSAGAPVIGRSLDNIDNGSGSRVDKTVHTVIKTETDVTLPKASSFPILRFDQ